MRKKFIVTIFMMMLAVGVTACGQDASSTKATTQETSAKEEIKEENEEEKEEVKQEEEKDTKEETELPNWRGIYDYVGYYVLDKGDYGINIAYPSLKPASSGCAYQMDPALVLVSVPGKDSDGEYVVIENVEDTLTASKRAIEISLKFYRNGSYTDFDFAIESQELMTLNDFPTCKYTGKHTYNYKGEAQEIPFVAYSFYTGQLENYSYFTVIVMDDSINNPTMDPLPEGIIDAYAKKMVESVELD